MPERVWQMTRIAAGDYLLPSNDRRSLWRISRYYEEGSLERGDGTKVVGWFWRAARHRDPLDRIAPHLIGEAAAGRTVEELLDWDAWVEHACLRKTREEAIEAALDAEPAAVQGVDWNRHRWGNEHAADCPVTDQRASLLKELARTPTDDPHYAGYVGAVPEYEPGGDQEAEECECGVVAPLEARA